MTGSEANSADVAATLLRHTEELSGLKDVDAILDRILKQARELVGADAGSIFLLEGDRLRFAHVQNETLFGADATTKERYADFTVPVDDSSIVGFTALTGRDLAIDDAYAIGDDIPYSFNPTYDEKSGYRTTSILSVPIKTTEGKLLGVMQIINARGEDGRSVPFPRAALSYVPLLANSASSWLERGIMTRELVLRMMKMAELRDPTETGAHVQRVGAYSAEIYRRWAKQRMRSRGTLAPGEPAPDDDPDADLVREADLIRLAAMLHDVGKVAIPDAILKKPGRLTDEEFEQMKQHTVRGAELFVNPASDLDRMCRDIALRHHEKWAGGGYPGRTDTSLDPPNGEPVSGEQISVAARITALADVYDALCSKRSYKEPWPEEKVLSIIEQESGKHFDPDVVEAFMDIHDIILAIRNKYRSDEK